jgi:hypothetical protein
MCVCVGRGGAGTYLQLVVCAVEAHTHVASVACRLHLWGLADQEEGEGSAEAVVGQVEHTRHGATAVCVGVGVGVRPGCVGGGEEGDSSTAATQALAQNHRVTSVGHDFSEPRPILCDSAFHNAGITGT